MPSGGGRFRTGRGSPGPVGVPPTMSAAAVGVHRLGQPVMECSASPLPRFQSRAVGAVVLHFE